MSTDRHGLFEPIDPPDGGAERLRRRLEAASRESAAPRRPLVAAASAVCVVAVVAAVAMLLPLGDREVTPDPERQPERRLALHDAPQFDRLLGRPFEREEPSVTLNDRTTKVAEIRTARENVRIYRLE